MDETGVWTPAAQVRVDLALLRDLASRVPASWGAGAVADDDLNAGDALERPDQDRLAGVMRQPRDVWPSLAAELTTTELLALVRLLTLAEMQFDGWRADAGSPVIPLCRELKRRGEWPTELSSWIRRHSDNRFLPYGSLADRLG